MPFPTTAVLDNFNRSNVGPPPSASWSQAFSGIFGQFKVVSNRAAVNSILNGYAENYYNVADYGGDCEAYVTLVTKPANATIFGLGLRMVDLVGAANPEGYMLFLSALSGTDTLQIDRIDNGVRTLLGTTVTQEISNGDSIGIRAIGSNLTCWYKASGGSWALLFSRTDATYSAAGRIEIITTSAATVLDDFGGGTYIPIAVTGGAVTPAVGSGASAYTPAPSGTTYTLAGGAVTVTTGTGAAAEVYALAGTSTSALTGSGIGASIHELSGAAVSAVAGAGAASQVYTLAGLSVSVTTGSGASEYITPGGTTYALAGSGYTTTTGAGTAQMEYQTTGGGDSALTASGTGAMTYSLPGTAIATVQGAGSPIMAYTLAGDAAALFAGMGEVMLVYPMTGGAVTELAGAGVGQYFNGAILTPPERRFSVSSESRQVGIASDARQIGVASDPRLQDVDREVRLATIAEEVRVYGG